MKIPVFFPVTREFGFRDEFAQDCLLQRRVTCEPDFRPTKASRRPSFSPGNTQAGAVSCCSKLALREEDFVAQGVLSHRGLALDVSSRSVSIGKGDAMAIRREKIQPQGIHVSKVDGKARYTQVVTAERAVSAACNAGSMTPATLIATWSCRSKTSVHRAFVPVCPEMVTGTVRRSAGR